MRQKYHKNLILHTIISPTLSRHSYKRVNHFNWIEWCSHKKSNGSNVIKEIEIFSSVTLPCLATIFMALGRSRFSIIFCYMHKLCETNGCYGVRGTKSDKWLCRVNGRLLKSVSKRQNLNYFHSQSFFFPFRIFSEQTKLNLICYKLHIVERNERKKYFFFTSSLSVFVWKRKWGKLF